MIVFVVSGLFNAFIIYILCLFLSYHEDMETLLTIKSGRVESSIGYYQNYEYKHAKELPKIDFNDFLKIYNIKKDAYVLCDAYVKREEKGKDIAFTFNFFDYLKYKKFKKNKDKYDNRMKEKKEECEVISKLISFAKEDIKELENKANEQINSAKNMLEKIKLE